MNKRKTLEERLWGKVLKTDGCWVWQGSLTTSGYGQIQSLRKNMACHRLSYIIHKGDIPDGLVVCHACDNRKCVNPDHLWLGTQKQNMNDRDEKGRNYLKSKTHCPQGHEYTSENTYREPATNKRKCRKCVYERNKLVRLKYMAAKNLSQW